MMVRLKRVYEDVHEDDGLRVLVERLWPRGVNKDKAAIDLWLKEIAPSVELRKWYGHETGKWEEFCRRYWMELDHNPGAVETLRAKIAVGPVTFVYAARDEAHNSAVALMEYLSPRG